MVDDPMAIITSQLEREYGITRAKVSPSTRLLHDLKIDGDDAAELIEWLKGQFGTDFAHLEEHWPAYFNPECMTLRSAFIWIVSALVAGPVGAALSPSHIPHSAVMILAFLSGLVCAWALHRFLPRREMRPVTIGQLADAVRRGVWRSSPANIS